jgi:RNA polymerase sigma-70 factor (ECF subfamily)
MAVRAQQVTTTALQSRERQARLRALVDEHIRFVTRTLKRAGVPPCDLDDEVQQTFIVAARRLDDMELGSERQFLYQVALNTAAHVRRRLARRREVMDDRVPEGVEAVATPEHLTSRKQMRRLLDEVAARMSKPLYEVFNLFEIEQANLAEIAARLAIPRGTVASRLRRARAQFRKDAAAIDFAWDLGSEGASPIEEPGVLSRESMSALMLALLRAGASRGASASVRVGTLAVLGFDASPSPR